MPIVEELEDITKNKDALGDILPFEMFEFQNHDTTDDVMSKVVGGRDDLVRENEEGHRTRLSNMIIEGLDFGDNVVT